MVYSRSRSRSRSTSRKRSRSDTRSERRGKVKMHSSRDRSRSGERDSKRYAKDKRRSRSKERKPRSRSRSKELKGQSSRYENKKIIKGSSNHSSTRRRSPNKTSERRDSDKHTGKSSTLKDDRDKQKSRSHSQNNEDCRKNISTKVLPKSYAPNTDSNTKSHSESIRQSRSPSRKENNSRNGSNKSSRKRRHSSSSHSSSSSGTRNSLIKLASAEPKLPKAYAEPIQGKPSEGQENDAERERTSKRKRSLSSSPESKIPKAYSVSYKEEDSRGKSGSGRIKDGKQDDIHSIKSNSDHGKNKKFEETRTNSPSSKRSASPKRAASSSHNNDHDPVDAKKNKHINKLSRSPSRNDKDLKRDGEKDIANKRKHSDSNTSIIKERDLEKLKSLKDSSKSKSEKKSSSKLPKKKSKKRSRSSSPDLKRSKKKKKEKKKKKSKDKKKKEKKHKKKDKKEKSKYPKEEEEKKPSNIQQRLLQIAQGNQVSIKRDEAPVSKGPMTKEHYQRKQNQVRRVYDPDSDRHRLVRGDGEIIEEIVSKSRHREINKQATKGDGASYAKSLGIYR